MTIRKTFGGLAAKIFLGLTLLAGTSTFLSGCYSHPVDKFLWKNVIPSGFATPAIKEKMEEERKLNTIYENVGPNPWKVIKVVNLDDNKSTVGLNYNKWPSYSGKIENLQSGKKEFPKNGYRVFKFESSDPSVNENCIESFRIMRNGNNGTYEEIYDENDSRNSCLNEEMEERRLEKKTKEESLKRLY